ncbi:undecaprenyl-diphosphate phosphatase [Blattabacterium cuenoti]|uniref:undecaprenyl-diphosphate phosphatase n=1 Tax=Blattabacterium cuenoti TaxID=1653831 RepID=UPI00163C14D6|nr:undecaprenyl-diphosphate phosphatase [Blattabacterium cuenoti]
MNYIQSILLGFIEGLTEFLPISSTGHMIIIADMMGILGQKITNLFLISVQFGAILSIIVFYKKKFLLKKFNFYIKIFIACLPIVLFGLFVNHKNILFYNSPILVSSSMMLGGIIILQVDNYYNNQKILKHQNITYLQSFVIGLIQCFAIIPGISRSATTIITCMLQNIHKIQSIEFSLFLSIPIIIIATCKKLFDYLLQINYLIYPFELHIFPLGLDYEEITCLIIGIIVSFVTGLCAIKWGVEFMKKHSLKFFGYYRIIFGFIFILYFIF